MIPRTLYSGEHELFRETVRAFIEAEVAPHHDQWERDGMVSREVWRKAGDAGLLGCTMPEAYGGPEADFRFSAIVVEELARAGTSGPAFYLHSDIVAPYIQHYGTEDQKQDWLPKMVRGETIGAIAMTEPGREGQGDQPDPGRTRARRLRAWTEPREGRLQGAGYVRTLLQRRARADDEPAGHRRGRRVHPVDATVAAGKAAGRHPMCHHDRGRARLDG